MPIQAINVRNQFRGKVREIIRGDVVSEGMDWVGHWDGKKIDESAKQPEDLAEAEFDEE